MERIVIDNSETFFKDILDKRSRFEENNLKSYGGDNYRLLGDYIEIFNSNFKTDIFLNSIDLKVGIRVVNCEFQSFTLENCRAEIDSNYFGRNYGVEIENSIFNDKLWPK